MTLRRTLFAQGHGERPSASLGTSPEFIEGRSRTMTCLSLIAALVIVVDRLAKYLVFGKLSQDQSIEVIPKLFHLTLVLNTGAAFGIFKNFTAFFAVSTFFVIMLIGVYAWRCKLKDLFLLVALGLILGGAISNLIDRLIFGYVIDFLDFRIWPVFNIADSCITVGSAVLVWRLIRLRIQ